MNKDLKYHLMRNNEQETLDLLENGANIAGLEQYLLWWAIDMENPYWIKVALQSGADIDHTDEDYVQSAYFDLINEGKTQYVEILIECGCDIVQRSYSLEAAALRGHIDLVNLLIENGADIYKNNSQAFNLAAQRDRFDVVGLFLNLQLSTQYLEYEKISEKMKLFIQQYKEKQNLNNSLSNDLENKSSLPSSKI